MRNFALLASLVAAAGCSDYYPVTIVVADGGTPSAPGSRSTVDAAHGLDGGRGAALDSSALPPIVDAAMPTEDAAPPGELPHDAGAVVEPVGDAASPTDSSMPVDSGPVGCPNQDGDALCDAVDACPYDAPNDSDGDGVCDSSDVCSGKNDYADADSDGVPDGCDTCPGKPDSDGDSNGYADACDVLLWSSREITTASWTGPPIAQFRACDTSRCDVVYALIEFQLSVGASVDTSATAGASTLTAELKKLHSGVPTVIDAAVFWPGKLRLHDAADNPLSASAVIARVRAFGKVIDGDVRLTLELRGY